MSCYHLPSFCTLSKHWVLRRFWREDTVGYWRDIARRHNLRNPCNRTSYTNQFLIYILLLIEPAAIHSFHLECNMAFRREHFDLERKGLSPFVRLWGGLAILIGSGARWFTGWPCWMHGSLWWSHGEIQTAAMAVQSSEAAGSMRYFSGDNEDAQEYKRWKTWTKNKIMTMDKLPKKAAGAFVYTLLTGKALECVEHLDPSKYQVENGDDIIFDLLDVRFPAKDQTDELGEMMNEVFTLRTLPGETLKGWIGRASELFDRLKRKTGVDFPQEARGWLILNRCGLSEEQRAVVLARADGMLHREQIGKALRSCFPDLVLSHNKRTSAAHLVDDAAEEFRTSEPDDVFQDVELLLAEYGHGDAVEPTEEFQESDVVDVLAVTWKEKRSEINRLQKARKFQQVKELKRQFRVEVEEIKKKSKCHKCGKLGHWARECSMKSSSSAHRFILIEASLHRCRSGSGSNSVWRWAHGVLCGDGESGAFVTGTSSRTGRCQHEGSCRECSSTWNLFSIISWFRRSWFWLWKDHHWRTNFVWIPKVVVPAECPFSWRALWRKSLSIREWSSWSFSSCHQHAGVHSRS